MNGKPFEKFDLKELDKSTVYSFTFKNILVAHYGNNSYSHGSVTYRSKPFLSNIGLVKILEHIESMFPEINYNDVLITKYPNE